MPPLVSVVMPVLDAAEWMEGAIASILAQTHRELELIIVDDGSTDSSRDIAASAAGRDSRVRALALEPDSDSTTSGRAANAGIRHAQGELIARMDADDLALPERLERQLAFLERSGLDACGGLARTFGAVEKDLWFPQSHEGAERELIFRVAILHPTMLARAELMRRLNYREDVSHEDYEWQIRAVAQGARLGSLQEVVLLHRVHPGQANRRHRRQFRLDLRRHRFPHVMRLFPGTSAERYQVLASLAERAPIRGEAELRAAGEWLLRLSDGQDSALTAYMARRWHKACDRAEVPLDAAVRMETAERFAAG
jgi:glycosyltransferase involved in cell wall biosynthesis